MAAYVLMKICGRPTKTGGVIKFDAQGPFPKSNTSRVALGSYTPLSKPEAKRLAAHFGFKVPRINTRIQLCADQHLENIQGQFQVTRNAPGDFQGAGRRRRR